MTREERYITSYDGTRLFSESAGEGFPIILCDGVGCDGFIWRYIWEKFTQHFKVIHFNYRSHGLSEEARIPNALKVSDYRCDLAAVMDAYEIDKALILGHSMGVQVILDYALQYPERIAGLVLICGSYGRPLDTFHDTDVGGKILPYIQRLIRFFPKVFQQVWAAAAKSELAYQVAINSEVNGKVIERSDLVPYFQHLSQMDPDVFFQTVEFMNEHSVEELLGEINTPTLIAAGQYDTFTPCWLSRKMNRLISDSELMVMPGGTHVAPIEIPELLELRIERFIEKHLQELMNQRKKPQKAPSKSSSKKAKSKKVAAKPDSKKTNGKKASGKKTNGKKKAPTKKANGKKDVASKKTNGKKKVSTKKASAKKKTRKVSKAAVAR